MEWKKLSDEAKVIQFVDLWAGGTRFPNCFWVEEKQSWVRVTRYRDEDNKWCQIFNVVTNPTHYLEVSEP